MGKTLQTRIVLRNDTLTAWEGSTKPLLKGEVALAKNSNGTYEVRIGQEGQTWSNAAKIQLSSDQIVGLDDKITSLSTTHYEVGALTELTAPSYVNGDTAVVKALIPGTSDKYTYTAYVYDKSVSGWKAMDGNYTADNVYFDENITCAGNYTQVGNISKGATATTTIESQGKNLTEVLQSIFTKRVDPAITQPSVSINNTKTGEYEVGTKVTPAYTVSFNPGSYTYGPATGVTATYSVTDNAGSEAKTTTSGSFNEITVVDNTSYTMSVAATHTDGALAKDNLGGNTALKISAGTKNATSGIIKGYRNIYIGSIASDTVDATVIKTLSKFKAGTGAIVKTLKASGGDITLVDGAKKVIIACPKNATTVSGTKVHKPTEVLLVSASNTPITDSYVKLDDPISITGANNTNPTDYDVWVYAPASIGSDEVHKITLN